MGSVIWRLRMGDDGAPSFANPNTPGSVKSGELWHTAGRALLLQNAEESEACFNQSLTVLDKICGNSSSLVGGDISVRWFVSKAGAAAAARPSATIQVPDASFPSTTAPTVQYRVAPVSHTGLETLLPMAVPGLPCNCQIDTEMLERLACRRTLGPLQYLWALEGSTVHAYLMKFMVLHTRKPR
ncbi:hypothetical protein POX_d04976 [Penicillium oxalicum]|uniref:hypothetical protein n=1 Tax=Penicillium oxalicum TaxID=69781 RepID=UPI0020B683BF|nr:hypothetical protein POX_d04976 [Penicillium oxalicum]KAI2789484.1 hypothetical protein POX_d04976 [Penicillium oxalicum]